MSTIAEIEVHIDAAEPIKDSIRDTANKAQFELLLAIAKSLYLLAEGFQGIPITDHNAGDASINLPADPEPAPQPDPIKPNKQAEGA